MNTKTKEELIKMYLDSLEENEIPWRKRWCTSANKNGISKTEYKGINQLLLSYVSYKEHYDEFKEEYLYQLNKLEIEKNNLDKKQNENNLLWLERFKTTEKFEEINRSLIINFINEIRIGSNKEIEIDLKINIMKQ